MINKVKQLIFLYLLLIHQMILLNGDASQIPSNEMENFLIVKFSPHLSEDDVHLLLQNINLDQYEYFSALECYIIQSRKRKALKQVYEMNHICYAEPIYLIPILEDPYYPKQWSLNNTGQNGISDTDIDAPEAWAVEKGHKDIVIAVIDTGIDYNHPDLSENIWSNIKEISNNQMDDDNNGYIDDIMGWDFVDSNSIDCDENEDCLVSDNDPMDCHGHGTQVSGIIGALSNNNLGIAGIAQNCQLMPLRAGFKTSSGDGFLKSLDAARAIIYAVDNGAKVINISWGDSVRSMLIEDAIRYAAENDVLICAASGNNNSNEPVFPAASQFSNIICVGGTDGFDMKSYFSNYGNWVHISAPGSAIFTTSINNSYEFKSGTSMAAAHVSGCSALIISHFLDISAQGIKSRLLRTADIPEKLNEKNLISGRINLYKSLTESFITPHIFSLNLEQAHENETLTIFGDSFDNNGNVIFFPGIHAEILSWTPQVIRCLVPAQAESGNLTVINSKGYAMHHIDINLKYYHVDYIEKETLIIEEIQQDTVNDHIIYSLPFPFCFFGIETNQINISSKGYIMFDSENKLCYNSIQNLTNKKMIAPLWDDLTINGVSQANEGIYIKQISSESVCIQWIAEHCDSENSVTVQTVLFKNGTIHFNYWISVNTEISPTIGISAGNNKAYEIIPVDSFDLFNHAICFTPRLHSFKVKLNEGWNMVSFPLMIDQIPISEVLGEAREFIEIIWGYHNNAWTAYNPNMIELSDLYFFDNGRGYWIKSTNNNIEIQCSGTLKYQANTQLVEGWNLIGPETLTSITHEKYDSLWHFFNGKWLVNQNQNVQVSELKPGRGYWVKNAAD